MEQNKFPVKILSAAAVVISLSFAACHNNDTVSNETTTDTTKTMSIDTAAKMPVVDSGVPAPSVTDTSAMKPKVAAGTAKPNPAKKGLKGKVSITTPPASNKKADAQPDATGVYTNVDHIPAFPGGNAGLQKFFNDNVQYPSDAENSGVEGTVMVDFTVDENGKVVAPSITGDRAGYGLDEEALRVISKMPSWVPGKVGGKPVRVRYNLPVKFSLQ